MCRYLGGDLSLVDEVCALRGFQQELAAQRPEDPRRIFGEAVEASGSNGPLGEQLVRVLSTMVQRLTAQDAVLSRIQARVDQEQRPQHVNLNVRAPKRPTTPHDPPIARDITGAGRPLPLARFFDQKEIADPSWRGVRRSLTPFFGMQMQVLKKTKLREEGTEPIYIEQNHRAQLLYTEQDRELMEEAWEMIAAHREDLVSRSAVAPVRAALPAAPAVPRALAMLMGV